MQHRTVLGVVLSSLMALPAAAGAQMVVHAVSGTVKTVDGSTLGVALSADTTSQFKIAPTPGPSLEFDPALRSASTEAGQFKHAGDFAVVYFYGYGSDQTAVALEDLGPGPFQKVTGTVTGFDKHARALTVKDGSGQSHTFNLSDHVVIDEDTTVVEGRHYSPHKGQNVVVAYSSQNQAVFIADHL